MQSSGIALVSVLVTACGSSSSPSASPDTPKTSSSSVSKADACLERAALPREPRKDAPERINVSQILVRHADLDRADGATRSRGEACLRAEQAREKLLAGSEWKAVVTDFSDAAGATHGALGKVAKEDLEPSFAAAAFALDVGEVSHVVESKRGFHVIVRTE